MRLRPHAYFFVYVYACNASPFPFFFPLPLYFLRPRFLYSRFYFGSTQSGHALRRFLSLKNTFSSLCARASKKIRIDDVLGVCRYVDWTWERRELAQWATAQKRGEPFERKAFWGAAPIDRTNCTKKRKFIIIADFFFFPFGSVLVFICPPPEFCFSQLEKKTLYVPLRKDLF